MKAIGVQFRSGIKIFDFIEGDSSVRIGDTVLVETVQGEELGIVRYTGKDIKKSESLELKPISKILSEKDMERLFRLKDEHSDYVRIFREKVSLHKLDMKLVDFEFSLDGEKVTFYFTADSRVDFRDLVRDLSRQIRKTVHLRQMGQRDEARMLDGFGACGRPICCRGFLTKMENISMDMARKQYEGTRSANKVSGICGKLMCCLAFEDANQKLNIKKQNDK